MLRRARGLSDEDLAAIADLEQRVVGHDGGRLKLEWKALRGRSGEHCEDVLAIDGDRLVGFAGLYGYGPSQVEITGMVDPEHRRRGLGSDLLDAALELCAAAGRGLSPLLIVPRASPGGRALALGHGATLDHSEHALALRRAPTAGPSDPAITVRTAQTPDVAALFGILSAGFGFVPPDLADHLVEADTRSLVFERGGEIVGTLRVNRTADTAGIYGFAIAPAWRGRGIGRDVLRRVCVALRADGVHEVGLEVEVENDRALGLYTSLGFTPVITEDYWRIPPIASAG
jgi:ribosomal protein S18 acetylase RimI-like enzyme